MIHMLKFKPEKFEKNSSTIGPLAGIEIMPLQCRFIALTTKGTFVVCI